MLTTSTFRLKGIHAATAVLLASGTATGPENTAGKLGTTLELICSLTGGDESIFSIVD